MKCISVSLCDLQVKGDLKSERLRLAARNNRISDLEGDNFVQTVNIQKLKKEIRE